ncbi:S8 family serine peptidase [Plantactinospora sp. BC1]|uniref:S8 family serine peptidase n=1 Tax=Plantactinospora sp. BC1 TaxID=2108470 RepID=UPI00131EE372|nr:S8 family serine peptidase [Plantactinospora sp. BC1]
MSRRLTALLVGALVVSGQGVGTGAHADGPPAGTVDLPMVAPEAPNLAGQGQLAVTLVSTATVDASRIDPGTVRLGPVGSVDNGGATVARWVGGGFLSTVTDVNADGRPDLRLFFDKEVLRSTGQLGAASTALTVTGRLPDGRPVRGSDGVAPAVVLEVKFAETAAVRGTDRALRSERGRDLAPVRTVLDRHRAVELSPLLPAQTLTRLAGAAATARARSGRAVPDMASWYHLTLPAGADVSAALRDLRALPDVAYAYPAPEPAPPPATPDFTSMQGYQRPAPQGVDADHARQDPRARGAGIRIVDLEYDWNPFHEDLQLDWSSDLGGTQFPRNTSFADEHGTAVFGELVARENGYGVTGGVPDAEMFGISPMQRLSSGQTSYRPAAALSHLAQFLRPGDAVLIEQQTSGPNGGTRYVPAEWVQSVFDATVLLTRLGAVVVATGGNGGENLDAPEFQGRFDRSVRDSGAIMVGAGSSTNRSRLNFSVYGSRLDLQGWGQNITTTGSNGNLQGGTSPANRDIRYTRSFGGTSGAGPIVTGAVVAIQSYLKATGRPVLTATAVSSLLKSTGTPQGGDTTQRIGPLPDLRAALGAVPVSRAASTTAAD